MVPVLKIRYVITHWDYELKMSGAHENIEIFPEGIIVIKEYHARSRKCFNKKQLRFPQEAFLQLCEEINICITTADSVEQFVDDSEAVLHLYYQYSREEKMFRGLGNNNLRIADIMSKFLGKYENTL